MAFGIKIGSRYLDLFPESQISFEKTTELWVTGDPTLQIGSYSFPFDVPLTDTNRLTLRFPERIDAYTRPVIIDGVVLYAGEGMSVGLPLFTGRLFVKTATNEKASIFIVVDGLSRQNEKKMEDVDMGVFNLGPPLELAAVMTYSANNPQYYPFIFFPVWNETIYKTYTGTGNIEYIPGNVFGAARMNHWTGSNWQFVVEANDDIKGNSILVPFLRLVYVLDKIITAMGYTLINEWMDDDDELQQICLFNNKSINDVEEIYKWKIRYNEHVPTKMLITEFLKHVAKWGFCGIFTDHASKTVLLRPYKTVLATAPRHDWTDRVAEDYEIEQDNTVPDYIGFDTDNTDEYFSNNFVSDLPLIADGAIITDYWEAGGNPTLHSLIDGYYHVKRDNSIMRYDPSRTFLYEKWRKWSHRFANIRIGAEGDPWLSKCIPMWSESGSPTIAGTFAYSIPRADIPLNIALKFADDEVVTQDAEMSSIRLMIYRGIRDMEGGISGDYPYANATAYDPATEDETFNHSLHYDGDKGMYNLYGKEWIYFMQNKKIVKRYLKLTIQDILNHKEYDKIRIGNMNYFVKSMRINVTSSGLGLTECELVTIVTS